MSSAGLDTRKCFNKCSLVDCPSTTFSAWPGAESTCPTYSSNVWREALHSHFLWLLFREWLEPQGDRYKFQSAVHQASCHLPSWRKRKHDELGVGRLGGSFSCVPSGCVALGKSSVLSGYHSSTTFVPGSASHLSGSSSLSSADIMAVGVRAGLHPGVHGRLGGASPGPVSTALLQIQDCVSISGQQCSS